MEYKKAKLKTGDLVKVKKGYFADPNTDKWELRYSDVAGIGIVYPDTDYITASVSFKDCPFLFYVPLEALKKLKINKAIESIKLKNLEK